MSPGLTTERVYAVLKAQIMEGERKAGERLDPARLAAELNASATPVRDALHQLLGERMVQARPGHGFQVPLPCETSMCELYAWNADLLGLLLRGWSPEKKPPLPVSQESGDRASMVATLFDTIASTLGNAEHGRAVRQANDRLHPSRKAETTIFTDHASELDDLVAAWADGRATDLRSAISRYHKRRVRNVAQIVARIALGS
jgi:DNA-binding FadR family transcriptional regulator